MRTQIHGNFFRRTANEPWSYFSLRSGMHEALEMIYA